MRHGKNGSKHYFSIKYLCVSSQFLHLQGEGKKRNSEILEFHEVAKINELRDPVKVERFHHGDTLTLVPARHDAVGGLVMTKHLE